MKKMLHSIGIIIIFTTVATVVGEVLLDNNFEAPSIAMLYILSVFFIARFTYGYIYGFVATGVSILTYNYFFTAPYYTLSVAETTSVYTFFVMLIISVITSATTTKMKQKQRLAELHAKQSHLLYEFTNNLTATRNPSDIIAMTLKALQEEVQSEVTYYPSEYLENIGIQAQSIDIKGTTTELVSQTIQDSKRENKINCFIDDNLGVLVYDANSSSANGINQEMIHSLSKSFALALGQFVSEYKFVKTQKDIVKEQERSNFLRSISHDIRSPLTGILGTTEILMGMNERNSQQYLLAETIHKDADYLFSMVGNILYLSKLQLNDYKIKKYLEPIEEVVVSVIHYFKRRYPEAKINVIAPKELVMIPMDSKLIMQVFINLIENAITHSIENQKVDLVIHLNISMQQVEIHIVDYGKGFFPTETDRIFELFYTSNHSSSSKRNSVGLGLAICKTIVEAHHGRIEAKNCEEHRGAEIVFTLPLEEEKSQDESRNNIGR